MKILVAVDGSAQSIKALEKALALGAAMSQPPEIALINVHNDSFVRRHQGVVGREAVDAYLSEFHESDLKEALALLQSRGVKFHVLRESGELAPTITRTAEAGGYDMIVMGAKGRSGLGDLLLGSVASRVLSHSRVPVLVVT